MGIILVYATVDIDQYLWYNIYRRISIVYSTNILAIKGYHMRRLADKVALVAHIGISAIFVLVTVMVFFNIIPLEIAETGLIVTSSFVMAIVMILAGVYVALTVYLLYVAFAQRNVVREVLLYSDATNNTNATSTVIRRIAVDNAKVVSGVSVKKLRITSEANGKLHMRITVHIKGNEVAKTIDTLRCLLVDSYATVLALKFDSIDFDIAKIEGSSVADLDKAKAQADVLSAGRAVTQEIFQEPIVEQGSIATEIVQPIQDDKPINTNNIEHTSTTPQQPIQANNDVDSQQQNSMYGTPDRPLTDDISVEIVSSDEVTAIEDDSEPTAEDNMQDSQDNATEQESTTEDNTDDVLDDVIIEIVDEPAVATTTHKKNKKK